jgi:hypothetical protein
MQACSISGGFEGGTVGVKEEERRERKEVGHSEYLCSGAELRWPLEDPAVNSSHISSLWYIFLVSFHTRDLG